MAQGVITGNPFWDFISGLLQEPSPEQVECQAPKPILLDTGEYVLPFAWHPIHIDTQVGKSIPLTPAQVLRIGQVLLLAVPGEFTTMAGRWETSALYSEPMLRRFRRLRESVAETAGIEGSKVVVAGLSNTYTHYITTWEEYQKQRCHFIFLQLQLIVCSDTRLPQLSTDPTLSLRTSNSSTGSQK